MRLTRLDVRGLRRIDGASLAPDPSANLILGDNGAGKTSLLEAIHLLAYGRSFRGRVRDGLVGTGAAAVEVFAEWQERLPPDGGSEAASAKGRTRRIGLRHDGQRWEGRLDGATVALLGELCAALAVVSFEPGSHALVSGGGEPRRRYVDWGLFHVEPNFLPLWRRYARALKQRNSLLKQRVRDGQLDAWDHELAEAGEPMTRLRQRYLDELQQRLEPVSSSLVPGLGAATLAFQPGWRRDELSLADALLVARERDLLSGFTSVGPHRADWRVRHEASPSDETLSRGQAKLTALACLLAQAEHYADLRGEWPIVLLDDLASELDRKHQARVLERLDASGAQWFVTGTEAPTPLAARTDRMTVFHVEQGRITPAPTPVS